MIYFYFITGRGFGQPVYDNDFEKLFFSWYEREEEFKLIRSYTCRLTVFF